MPSIDDFYGSDKTLRESHLPPGRSVPVTIERVTTKSFDDGNKLELKFAGKQRVLICNKTNAGLIAKYLRQPDYTAWVGQQVYLKAAKTEFRGELVPCIRVDIHPPTTVAPVQPAVQSTPGEVRFVPDNPAEAATAATQPEDTAF